MVKALQTPEIAPKSQLERAATQVAVVNLAQCRRLAELISAKAIPADREESVLSGFTPEESGNFYFLLVAICHQTSPAGRLPLEGRMNAHILRGWDYLSAKLEAAARLDPALLSPSRWLQTTADGVSRLFHDEVLGDRLSDPSGRALLIRDLGQGMARKGWNHIQELYQSAGGRIATGEPNLLSLLSDFRAYDDPVRKKSYFFLALMRNARLWTYVDPEELGAPVDYHEVRGHLRIGTVELADPQLKAKLLAGTQVSPEEDIAIRQAVHDAIMLLSEMTGLRNPSQLHYLFWNVFRSCCTRDAPHCGICPPTCLLPQRYVPLAIHPDGIRRCPFSDVCQSAGKEPKLVEHSFSTDYY